jgi:hypothetical protein
VSTAVRNGGLASAVLSGGVTKVPPPNLVLHWPRCLPTPVGLASGAGPSHGDGRPAPGHSISARRPAGHPNGSCWRFHQCGGGRPLPGGPSREPPAPCPPSPSGVSRGTLGSSTGYIGAHRLPAAVGGQPTAPAGAAPSPEGGRQRAGWSLSVPTSAGLEVAGQELSGCLVGWSQRQPRFRVVLGVGVAGCWCWSQLIRSSAETAG